MTMYFGGLKEVREIDHSDAFEVSLERALGDMIRDDDQMAADVWSALANVEWISKADGEAAYSFRAAGDLVAAIRGEGNYLDWYCAGPVARVSDAIRGAMAKEGWSPDVLAFEGP